MTLKRSKVKCLHAFIRHKYVFYISTVGLSELMYRVPAPNFKKYPNFELYAAVTSLLAEDWSHNTIGLEVPPTYNHKQNLKGLSKINFKLSCIKENL